MTRGSRWWDPRVRLPVTGAVLLAVGICGGLYLLREHPRVCDGATLPITVAAAPDIAPALGEIAARFNLQTHEVVSLSGSRCVRVAIVTRDPSRVAQAPAARRGADGWVPDSSMWLLRARAAGMPAVGKGTPLAASPVVIVVPRAVAAELRARRVAGSWRLLRYAPLRASVRALDPVRSAAGAATTIAVRETIGTTALRRDLDPARLYESFAGLAGLRRPLIVAAEQSVVGYNDTHRPNPAAVILPAEGTILLDHPLAATTADPLRVQAIDAFRWMLGARQALETFQRYGFRQPDGRFAPEYAGEFGLRPTIPKVLPQPGEVQVAAAMLGQ